MSEIAFSKWSPCGNTTLFFQASIPVKLRQALAKKSLLATELYAEQAGFVDTKTHSLTMAGGEFCLNATRAFGALLALEKKLPLPTQVKLSVSGWPDMITCSLTGKLPHWFVTATLTLPKILIEDLGPGIRLVRLPGITHLLLDGAHNPHGDSTADLATFATLRKTYSLEEEACVGAIWWWQESSDVGIRPLVYVRDTETTIFENACGSGSLALALAKNITKPLRIRQPGGDTLTLSLDGSTASIGGSVSLLCQGTYYFQDA